jgi:hypothetical protein
VILARIFVVGRVSKKSKFRWVDGADDRTKMRQ